MQVKFSDLKSVESGNVVFPVSEDLKLPSALKKIDDANLGSIYKAIKSADFKGKHGKFLSILGGIGNFDRIVLVGTGGDSDDDEKNGGVKTEYDIQALGGKIYSYLNGQRIKQATVVIEESVGDFFPEAISANLAYGARLKSYNFDKYFTKKKDDEKPALEEVSLALGAPDDAVAKYEDMEKVGDGVFLTRDVVSEPPNVLYPESYADRCKELKSLGVKVEILDEKDMRKLGMGSLLAVGQGSEKESQLVVMQWNGADDSKAQPIAFVGKGVTFDTGGISIKPSKDMHEMKYDMAGSGAVVGLMAALAGRKARVNAVGVVGLVENMPGGGATRPGDVVTSMSGQTIEVLNTDAEGRMVLADALWYTQNRFKPQFMVNLATLTGAIVVALADQYAGLFSNNDELSERLAEAGEKVRERLWRFPMGKEYDEMIDSKVADVQNIGDGRGAGSITAGQFLQRFVNDAPWAHLDIAGMAWADKALDITPKGASGFGVRLLNRLVEDHYEG